MVFHPFGNETTLPPAGWHPEPHFRGSFSILSTSLLTLFLCVWTVVHTNVPQLEEDRRLGTRDKLEQFLFWLVAPSKWRRTGWMLLAILAPEVVAWNAFEQRRTVKETTKEVRQYIGDSWTDTHSWFAVMGGFAFDSSHAPEPLFPKGRRRVTIMPRGIVELAQTWPQLLLKDLLTREHNKDKSNADNLTKFLACWQAVWFCVQCIFRLSSGLSISLLELNVFGHAVCALLIYILWWGKPQDVTEPHVLAADDAHKAAAALCTFSQMGAVPPYNSHWWFYDLALAQPDDSAIELSGPVSFSRALSSRPPAPEILARSTTTIKVGDACWRLHWPYRSRHSDEQLTIDEWTLARLKYGTEPSQAWKLQVGSMVRARAHDWSITLSDGQFGEAPIKLLYYLLAITFASGVYGGLHILAFWSPFPSPIQQLLWRISCLTVAASGPIIFVLWVVADVSENLISQCVLETILNMCFMLALMFYFCCRGFLVVECFISLAYLSESQLAIPTWSLYVPHIS